MKKLGIGLTAVLAMVLGMAVTALAQPNGLYLAPKIGYSHLKGKFTETFYGDEGVETENYNGSKGQLVLGLAVGYDFKPVFDVPLRTELEYAWRGKKELYSFFEEDLGAFPGNNGFGKIKVGAQSFFVNAFFDIYNPSPVTPYIGAGLGFARLASEFQFNDNEGIYSFGTSKSGTNFAWNIGAGAAWKVAENVALDLGYRYVDFGNVTSSSPIGPDDEYITLKTKASTHEVLLGLRYTF